MFIGTDLVFVPKIRKLLSEELQKIYTANELTNNTAEHLAGILAAKEAFFKTLGYKADWHDVWIEYEQSGRPILHSILLKQKQLASVSISHDGEYAIAVVLIYENSN
jgi:phosphopantetheine--protein transferase-like protein